VLEQLVDRLHDRVVHASAASGTTSRARRSNVGISISSSTTPVRAARAV
jgi:hypothetical protein